MSLSIPVETEVDIDLYCNTCSYKLTASYDKRTKSIDVTPCPDCLEKAEKEGRERGIAEVEG